MATVNTLGELRKLLQESNLPDETLLIHICDHGGITTLYSGSSVDLTPRFVCKSDWCGLELTTEDDPNCLGTAIRLG
jgi:hypothetical protein